MSGPGPSFGQRGRNWCQWLHVKKKSNQASGNFKVIEISKMFNIMTLPYVVFVANKFVSNWSFYLVYTFCSVSPQQKPGHAGVLCSGHFWLWWRHPGGSGSLKTRLPLPNRLPLLSDCLLLLLVFLSLWGHSSLSQNLMELSVSGSKVRVFSMAKYLN